MDRAVSAKSVVITGASSGIGRACALRLGDRGWRVFAGVRKEADGEKLQSEAQGRLVPLIIDVTDRDTIEAAAARLGDELDEGLHGLLNNAGVSVQGPLEYLPLDELRRQLEVNVMGQLAVTQALLSLIRRAQGRIVMMSSIGGRTKPFPFLAPYAISKYALEALGDSLRYELLRWKIHVAIIEPGSIATPIWEKGDATFDQILESLPATGRERYADMLERARRIGMATGRRGVSPEKVADAVEHALSAARPRVRYLVGIDAKVRAAVEPLLPERVLNRIVARMMRA